MKCPHYDRDAYGCISAGGSNCPSYGPVCSGGWLTYWTPAERAGLKAMGKEYLEVLPAAYSSDASTGAYCAINAYVRAARAVKEARRG